MPQGVVVAIKPRNLVDEPDNEFDSGLDRNSDEAFSQSMPPGDLDKGNELGNIIYISLKDNTNPHPQAKEKIVWFEDVESEFVVGNSVQFEVSNGKKRKIYEAVNVKKKLGVPEKFKESSLLLKVAMLTSLVLIGSFLLNKKNL